MDSGRVPMCSHGFCQAELWLACRGRVTYWGVRTHRVGLSCATGLVSVTLHSSKRQCLAAEAGGTIGISRLHFKDYFVVVNTHGAMAPVGLGGFWFRHEIVVDSVDLCRYFRKDEKISASAM